MRKLSLFILLALSMFFLAACGGGGEADSGSDGAGDASRGEQLYTQTTIGSASAPGCVTCHSLEPDVVLVGPSHNGIGARAETAVPGLSAADYLEQSIREPNAHVTDGFTAGVMYQNYANELSDQEIADLVAFLLTLK
ncbi:MAG: c-type cytochrome [Anaerolineae bacterium]